MKQTDEYVDLDGITYLLKGLDPDERRLVARLRRRAKQNPAWDDFDNYRTVAIPAFYQARGLARKAVPRTVPWRIAQDLSSRLGIAQGYIAPDNYRSQLEALVRKHYPSRRAFCEATGLTEDMLSHVLAGRKDLSLEALTQALERIGYCLQITPSAERKQTG